jgi:hypothetical protein
MGQELTPLLENIVSPYQVENLLAAHPEQMTYRGFMPAVDACFGIFIL